MKDARERLADQLDVSIERGRAENGAWVVVTFDDEGAPVNAAGPYPSEPDAFLAARAIEAEDPEPGWTRVAVPLFAP